MNKCRGSDEIGSDYTTERAPEPCDWFEIEGYGGRWSTEAEARGAAIEIARSHVRDGHAPGRYRVVKYTSLAAALHFVDVRDPGLSAGEPIGRGK